MKKIIFILIALISLSVSAKKEKRPTLVIETNMGKITVELYNETPQHRDNFIKLAKEGFFDNLLFHRVIQDFMIQGGDPDSRDAKQGQMLGEGGPGYDLPAEIMFPEKFHKRGVLAAAREGDDVNPERKSSGSQFYIVWGKTYTKEEIEKITSTLEARSGGKIQFPDNVKKHYVNWGGTPWLDGAYTVFGEVTKGLDIVNAIQQVNTDRFDRPTQDVRILGIKVKK